MVGNIFIPLRPSCGGGAKAKDTTCVTAEAGIPLVAGIENGETYLSIHTKVRVSGAEAG